MQVQTGDKSTSKTKSILYRLKRNLEEKKIFFDTHVCNLFEYRKQKFTRKQFHKLIKKYDQNLILSDIDTVYEELSGGKNYVLFSVIEYQLEMISEEHNPSLLLNRRSVLSMSSSQKNQASVLIEFKDLLTENEDYLDTIELFMTDHDGYLSRENIKELMDNMQFKDQNKINKILQILLGENEKIELKQFLQKLDLNNSGTRIHLSDFSIQESIILENRKSEYIKNQQNSRINHSLNLSYSRILDGLNLSQSSSIKTFNSGIYALEKIPEPLTQYFNYGSELEEPFANLACGYIENGLVFIDSQGPTYQKAKKWIHITQWSQNYFLFQAAESIVYRAEDRKGLAMLMQPKDITQGKYGNCYFLSAVAAIVEAYPELVYRLFVLQKNPSHIYGVRLFVDGIWNTVAVDCCFPLNEKGKFCGAQPHHSQIWVMLLQKAWAKLFKTYQNIHSGYNQQGLVAISGAPTIILMIQQSNFIEKVHQQFKKGSIITCTTAKHISQLTDAAQDKIGVYAGHAYTILKIYNDVEVGGQKIVLIKMKNPWGTKAWKGDWSFQSKKWTKQLRDQLNYKYDSKDGTFFIGLPDFIKYFDHINISKVNLGYRNSYISNFTNRYDFYSNIIKITQPGTYFFTVYQDNGRKYKNSSGVYQKSPSWLFLANLLKGSQKKQIIEIKAVTCNASGYQHSTVQAYLEAGQYVLLSKVSWNYWEEHTYTITGYGPAKVFFEPGSVVSIQLLNKFITSWAYQKMNQKKVNFLYYKDTNIWKCFHFHHSEGIGFVTIGNNLQQNENEKTGKELMIQSTLTLQSCKGIQVLAPYTNPILMKCRNGQIITACCIVDPQGYSYKLTQGYKLYMGKTK